MNDEPLRQIRREIADGGPISFARFMELALYHPLGGYYARGPERLGPGGDFITAADVGRAFGRCMARQLLEIDALLGRPRRLSVIEFGAGRGLLARDLLDAARALDPDAAARIDYVMVDRSAAMREAAARRTPEAACLAEAPVGAGRGLVLAVELFDALPVHRVRRRGGALVEVGVDLSGAGELIERELAAPPALVELARRRGAAAEEGFEAEVAPALAEQLGVLERALERGVLLIVDYGHRARELYAATRARGTLLAYHRHAVSEALLERVGEQDLTAHVDFSALEDAARELGLTVLGLTTQDRFLIGNGILGAFEQKDLDRARDPARVRERLQASQLIHPAGMGRTFKVLALAKNLDPPPSLSGLVDPFARR